MTYEIRDFVNNPHDPNLQEMYDAINDLVDNAGHITIEDLFTKNPNQIEENAWRAIQRAKDHGLLMMASNNSCCSNNRCVDSERGFCNQAITGGCTIASDACSQVIRL